MAKVFVRGGRGPSCAVTPTTRSPPRCSGTSPRRRGEGGVGDRVETLARDPALIAVAETIRVYASDRNDLATIERLAALDVLPEDAPSHFAKKRAAVSTTATP
jgi:hypothetical protein